MSVKVGFVKTTVFFPILKKKIRDDGDCLHPTFSIPPLEIHKKQQVNKNTPTYLSSVNGR